MKYSNLFKVFLAGVVGLVAAGGVMVGTAFAATPQLQVSNQSGNQVMVTVNYADAFAQVDLYSRANGSSLWTTFTNIGRTDGSGYFSTTGYYASGYSSNDDFYVRVNGYQSNTVQAGSYNGNTGCSYYGCYGGNISFSQTNPTLNVGQSLNINIYGSSGVYTISNNSNSYVLNASIAGSTLYLYGQQTGSTTLTICANNYVYNYPNNGQCGTLTVNVYGTGGSNSISFSQSYVTLAAGQSQTVSIYGNQYGSSYYVSGNTDTSIASATVNGSVLTIYGYRNGTTSVSVCGYSGQCGSLPITVTGGSGYGNITFSTSYLNLNIGQNQTVTVQGGSGSYYISSNSNSNVATASVSGSSIYINAVNTGSTTISVCSSVYSQCGSLTVSVGGNGGAGNIWFSPNIVTFNQGQSFTVTIYGNQYSNNYYVLTNDNTSVVTTSISGNSLTMYGSTPGTARITVCSYNISGCGVLTATVLGSNSGNQLILSNNNLTLSTGQTQSVTVYGGLSNQLYISSNSTPSVATAMVSGNTVSVYAQSYGTTNITICSYGNYGCGYLSVNVSGGYYNGGGVLTLGQSQFNIALNTYANITLQSLGGTAPYNYSISSGNFPPGLSLSNYGQITGMPTQNGTFTPYIRVSDNYGRTGIVPITITIGNSGSVSGISTFRSGEIVKDNGTIYIIYNNTKTPFGSWTAFTGLGYKLGMVVDGPLVNVPDSGYVVNTMYAAHPWGSWVLSGKQIYFVHQDGLIPVPSMDVFYSNNGSLDRVVKANSWDLRKPRLPVMDNTDYRIN